MVKCRQDSASCLQIDSGSTTYPAAMGCQVNQDLCDMMCHGGHEVTDAAGRKDPYTMNQDLGAGDFYIGQYRPQHSL